jgi:hypothetical protein
MGQLSNLGRLFIIQETSRDNEIHKQMYWLKMFHIFKNVENA